MTGHAADAEDATQEALIKIVRGLPRFTGGSGFGTWAYRVAVNVCLDELRRRRRRPTPGLPEDDGAANGGATLGGSRPAPAPVESVVADRVDVDAALARVTPEFRAAVVLPTSVGSGTPRSPRSSTSRPVRSGPASPGAGPPWPI